MYLPPHFAQNQPEELQRILTQHPLGVLVTHTEGQLDADHIPFEFVASEGPHGVLRAHVARANPLWQRCPSGTPVLVIFRAAESYISPNWYPSKHVSHRQVPTWNYEVVHAHGTLSVHDDERFVRGLVARLTRRHESNEPQPWKMGDSEPAFIDTLLRNIVGIEIQITALVGKSKLSQNKDAADRLAAAATLETRGHTDMAQSMRSTC